jgi:archaellum component FlaC
MKRLTLTLLTGSIVALSGLTSCSQAPSQAPTGGAAPAPSAAMESSADRAVTDESLAQKVAAPAAESFAENTAENTATQRPQLIKRASLSLSVDSIEDGFKQVKEIVNNQKGDILSLSDEGDRQRSLSFEIRVPQDKLDATLDALTGMGSVRARAISTEDVSTQLVDIQARLSNARKSEEALQEIMTRTGAIADVLQVSRELSTVRESIEQMSAQQKNLQTQVSYSTISLNLESAIALSPNKPVFARQLANSWESATSSVGDFTTDLLQLGLWLLAYSPYLAALLCGAIIARKVARRSPQ